MGAGSRPFGLSWPALVAGAIVVVLLAVLVLPLGGWLAPYLPFVIATALAVRTLPAEPGSYLRRQRTRRAMVVLIVAACLLLTFGAGSVAWLVLVVVLLDVALGRATGRVAGAPDEAVDERQEDIRNRVHRQAYWLLALLLGGVLLGANIISLETRRWVWDAFHGSLPLAVAELTFFLPTMILAWREPDAAPPEGSVRRASGRAVVVVGLVSVAVGIPLVLAASIGLAPVRVTELTSGTSTTDHGKHCVLVHAREVVGWAPSAVLPLDGMACGDGTRAQEEYGFNESDCHPNRTDGAIVTTLECSRKTDAEGTLRFTYTARVESDLLPFFGRAVTLSTAVDRNGRVVELP